MKVLKRKVWELSGTESKLNFTAVMLLRGGMITTGDGKGEG